jgi:DNA mismatch endonuclease, patch repair protein
MKRERKCIRSRAPAASSPDVRRVMQAVMRSDTAAELLLRRRLHAAGLRFRKEVRPEPDVRCAADVVLRRQKVCIFIDGCFWHRCPVHFKVPRTNSAWWKEKIQATVDRDEKQQKLLESRGWTVLRFWEHGITPSTVDEAVQVIETALGRFKRRRAAL